jgi:hypothetical protein
MKETIPKSKKSKEPKDKDVSSDNNCSTYYDFLASKKQLAGNFGFEPTFIPDIAFPFQQDLIDWSVRKGRGALFADCGMGKTLIQLAWAKNVAEHTGGKVLILTPLSVSHQTVMESEKFGIEAARSDNGEIKSNIVVTNYERLHYFNPEDFEGVVCDESSILKNFDGSTKSAITEFMRTRKYRLLCTATAAPNDFIELGTSSEALGHMGFMDMIGRFFKKADQTFCRKQETMAGTYLLKPHAASDFWRWVCSWARAVRKPSDLGYDDGGFQLPKLITRQHIVEARSINPDFLFEMPAVGLAEQRNELSRTVEERCEMAAKLATDSDLPFVCWVNRNIEGDRLEKMIPGAVQVSGGDSDEVKEERFRAFESGDVRVLVTKPTIAGFGLNWQHCANQTFFPSHSFEQWYQSIRRSWRFGQTRDVVVDVIATEGQSRVLANLERKAEAADRMFGELVGNMNNELKLNQKNKHTNPEIIPSWL